MVCGFCSTGCGLDVHLQGRRGGQPDPAHRLPGEPGHGLPQGLGGADAAGGARPGDRRRCCATSAAAGWSRSTGPTALDTMVTPVQGHPGQARPGVGGLPQHRPDRHRGDGAAGGAGQVRDGHGPRRRQHPPVHGHRRSSPTSSRSASTPRPTPTPTSRSPTSSCWSARTCASPTRSCGSASAATRTSPRSWSSIRARPRPPWPPPSTWPLRPKSDLALLYGLAHLLIERGLDRSALHRRPHQRLRRASRRTWPASRLERVGRGDRAAGRAASSELARLIHEGKRVSFWWTMGVNQSHEAARVAQAIINLALITGNIGRPGHRRQLDHRPVQRHGLAAVQQHHQPAGRPRLHQRRAPPRRSPASWASTRRASRAQDSLAYDQILEKILAGQIKGLWIVATNPAHSWINQRYAHDVLSRLDFLVVQDMYTTTETAALADLVLPAAGWGEKEGTFINSERRIGLIKKVARAPGQALADFHIFQLVAEAWGCGDMFRRWSSPEAVFQILKQLLARPALRHHRHRRLRHDRSDGRRAVAAARGRRARSRASAGCSRRALLPPRRPGAPDRRSARARCPSRPASEYPLMLLTGRGSSQPVAHPDPHREVGGAAPAGPDRAVRRDQPGRRRAAEASPQRVGGRSRSRRGDRSGPGPSSPTTVQAGPGVHAHALRRR